MTLTDPGDTFFPYNAVAVMQTMLQTIDPDTTFFRRRILNGDPTQSIGIAPVDWSPGAYELGQEGPTTQDYTIYVQSLIVDPDPERGLRMHSYFAMRVRQMLARMTTLRVGLRQLESSDPFTQLSERTTNVRMGDQVFHSQEFDGDWNWLSTAEMVIETQNYRQ